MNNIITINDSVRQKLDVHEGILLDGIKSFNPEKGRVYLTRANEYFSTLHLIGLITAAEEKEKKDTAFKLFADNQ